MTSYLSRIKQINGDYQKKSESKRKSAPKQTGSVLYKYASKLVNNRVLDLYLKALGVTTLTATTLVPLALVMGATTFSDTVEDILGLEKRAKSPKAGRPRSGFRKSKKDEMHIPILDDSVFGTYTKYAGAAVQLALSPFTLIPIGLAVAIYEMFKFDDSEQKGGGSSWVMSQNSGGPINSANIWADRLSTALGPFGPQMTPAQTQAITGYPFQQQPNTTLTIAPVGAGLSGMGAGSYGASGGRRVSRRSKSRSRVKDRYRRRRSSVKA